jgi:CRISPR system Cascade subunit CasA
VNSDFRKNRTDFLEVNVYSFNLVSEPWIPVKVGGKLELYSLEKTLIDAAEIERIEDASPLVTVALHRLLLAVLHRALKGPKELDENAAWFENGFPTDRIKTYLETWKHRFDLFSTTNPFYQVAGYENESKSIAQLAAELASGNNVLLFDHTNEITPPALTPAEVTRLLIARQMLAIPEGPGYSPSPAGSKALILPLGNNLLETLCLNLTIYVIPEEEDSNVLNNPEKDVPIWESEKQRPNDEQIILGLTHRYTWMSRLVRLIPEKINGKCVVRSLHYAAACKSLEGAVNVPDPMLAYRVSDVKTGEIRALNFRRDRAFWRDFTALLPKDDPLSPQVILNAERVYRILEKKTVIKTMVLGATNKQAKFEFWRSELYLLPEAVNADRSTEVYSSLEDALKVAETIGKALRHSLFYLFMRLEPDFRNQGKEELEKIWYKVDSPPPPKGEKPVVTRLRKKIQSAFGFYTYWTALDKEFPELLRILTENYQWNTVEKIWLRNVLDASNHAWELTRDAVGDDAFALRAIYAAEGLLRDAQKPLKNKLDG